LSAGIVVIGGGQAAAAAVAKLRQLDDRVPLTMVCAEAVVPYQRPPLSKKYLSGEMPLDRVILRPREWYDDNAIELHLGVAATALRPQEHKVVLSNGAELAFDSALLATGSQPRRLPDAAGGNLKGVHYLRSTLDSDQLRPSLQPKAKVIVIGGGYIGLEVAAVAAAMGLDVHLIEAADRILQRVAAPQTSDFYRDLHKANGVTIHEGVGVTGLLAQNGRVCAAQLDNGTQLTADCVLVGIGVLPVTDLASGVGLAVDNGICVDDHCRTSAPKIFAAGDCCSFLHKGSRIRLESVPHAIHQSEVAAENMLGNATAYQAEPWFWSDQYDVKLQIAGLNTGYDQVVQREGRRPGAQSVWYYRNRNLVAVDAMNDAPAFMTARKLLAAGKSVPPEVAGDASNPVKSWTD